MEFEIDLDRAVGAELDLPLGRGIADGRSDEGEAARGKVLQEEMPRGIGGGSDRGTLQRQCGIGDVFAGAGIDDMARDVLASVCFPEVVSSDDSTAWPSCAATGDITARRSAQSTPQKSFFIGLGSCY